ncbi:ABC transporter permease [Jiangella endophytica]|uniref:ABC transporter permease n=1 Tax=Jiangella endophytica TaxID=1623398 RepID=UPI000E353FF7|nr:ABC transporter permease [Jiangella endophytica]
MLDPLTLGLIVAVAAVLAFVAVLLGKAVLRRLAGRQLTRRPAETILVVLGSVLGTALIVASLAVGDSLDRSVRQTAYDVLGPVDESVRSATLEQGDEVAQRLAPLASDPRVDGLLTIRGDQAAAVRQGADGVVAEPRVLLWEVDFDAAAGFGAPDASGLDVADPGPGGVVINANLAGRLGAGPGDELVFHAYGQRIGATVTRVVPAEGLAGLGLGASANQDAFVSPGVLTAAAAAGGVQPTTTSLVSNAGGVESGAELTDEVSAAMADRLGPLTARGASVATPKQDVLDAAAETGESLGSLFLFIGSFCIIAGILLLVNVFVMLADERRGQLGILRAIGMRRRHVTGEFAIEGAVYALTSAVLGAAFGVLLGRVVVAIALRILNSYDQGGNQLRVAFEITPASLIGGAATGFLFAFLAVVLTSVRIARTNIIAAIRDLEPPVRPKTRTRLVVLSAVATVLLTAAAIPAVVASAATQTYLLPTLAAVAAVPMLSRLIGSRAALTVVALGVLAWGLLANTVRPDIYDEASTAPYVVLGCMLSFAAVTLVSLHQPVLLRPFRRLVERPTQRGLATRLAVAYPTAKRFRTGATLAMYSVVVLVIVLMTQIMTVIDRNMDQAVADATSGWSLRLDYNPTTPIANLGQELTTGPFAGRITDAAPLTIAVAEGDDPRLTTDVQLPVVAVGVPEDFTFTPPVLDARLARLPSDRAAWDLVRLDPAYVLVDTLYGSSGGPPGEPVAPGQGITLTDPRTGREVERTVAGVVRDGSPFYGVTGADLRFPVFMGIDSVVDTFGVAATQSSAMLRTAPGVDVPSLATQLQGVLVDHGVVATDLGAAVEQSYAANNQFFRLMQGYLALGLLVGITSLGVIMVRAVRERRRAIGVLRALGFQARTIRTAFLAESAFIAVEGVVIGSVLGVVITWLLYRNSAAFETISGPYPIAWGQILTLVAVTLVASAVATLAPAQRAARIRPAVAVRVRD